MTPKRLTAACVLAAMLLFAAVGTAVAGVHRTVNGDTLWSIAKEYHTTTKSIAHANGLKPTAVLPLGKKLIIPAPAARNYSASKAAARVRVIARGVVAKSAPLRSEPSTGGKRVALLKAGTPLKILQTKWHWHQVKTASGTQGWVGDYLVRVTKREPPPKSSHNSHHYVASRSRRWGHTRIASHSPASHHPHAANAGGNIHQGAVRTAFDFLGARYRYGGTSRGGFDCSGFTRYVYAKHGIRLPHNSAAQFHTGEPVPKSKLKPGDLVFFSRGGHSIGHVGIYAGHGKFVHASNPRSGVKVSSLNSGHYARIYRGARRVE